MKDARKSRPKTKVHQSIQPPRETSHADGSAERRTRPNNERILPSDTDNGGYVAKQTEELDLFSVFEQLKEKAPDEETRLTEAIETQLNRLNMVRTTFLGKPALSLQEPATAPRPATKKAAAPKVTAAPGPSANYDEGKKCPYCETPGHDGRAHRTQEPKKKFTKEELTQRGLMPPEASQT